MTLLSVSGLLQGEVEKQRAERRERARNPKFNFRNYDGLRSSDDYAKVSGGHGLCSDVDGGPATGAERGQ